MYDVVLLIERELSELDAQQVTSLHEAIEDEVAYHVILPVDEAAASMEASMGTLAGPELAAPISPLSGDDLTRLRQDVVDAARRSLQASVGLLARTGHAADGIITNRDPIETLTLMVSEHRAAEAIILTAPHAVKEFFHVDWTSRARRKLGVPTLHLLEHETFDEQSSGAGEGTSLI